MTTTTPGALTRRHFTALAGSALLVPAMARRSHAQTADTIRIGFVGPRSGPLGIFGAGDAFLVEHFNRVHAEGIEIGGRRYGIEIVLADTQSDPVRGSLVTRDLITGQAPETVNPVA